MITQKLEFINYLKDNSSLSEKDQWKKNTNLYTIWNRYVDSNDIRYKLCNGDVEIFVDTIYFFIETHLNEFLGIIYDNTFSDKTFKPIDNVKVNGNEIIFNKSNNPGYFRNICFKEIVICGGDNDINLSIKQAIVNTLNGKVRKTFFIPSFFEDIYNGKISSNMVLTFNKSCKLASIFSPNIYRYLLKCLKNHSAKSDSILFATASWGVPVVAANHCGYKTVDIVDVQAEILNKCHNIWDDMVKQQTNILVDIDTYTIETFCTPSESMDQIINKKYDHIISCPPYYDLEIYGASDKQSTDLYKTYPEWLESYWRKTVIASKKLLNENGVFAFIMGRYVRYQYMSDDMVKIAMQEGFTLIDEIKIIPKKKPNNIYLTTIEKYEICSIFKIAQNIFTK